MSNFVNLYLHCNRIANTMNLKMFTVVNTKQNNALLHINTLSNNFKPKQNHFQMRHYLQAKRNSPKPLSLSAITSKTIEKIIRQMTDKSNKLKIIPNHVATENPFSISSKIDPIVE